MEQPVGYKKNDFVCKLKKAIYGLKQAGREWNLMISKFFNERNFNASEIDTCFYVDDLIIAADQEKDIIGIWNDLNKKFKMKNLGKLNYLLGISIQEKENGMILSQELYRKKVLSKFEKFRYGKGVSPIVQILESNEKDDTNHPFQNILGSLMYMSDSTRPDLTFAISFLSRKMKNPTKNDVKMLNGVLSYLEKKGNLCLEYSKMEGLESNEVDIAVYADSDWANDKENRASVTGYICLVNGTLVSWRSKKQDTIAQSSTEAKYVALYNAIQESIWIRQILEGMNFKIRNGYVTIFQDNQGAIKLAENAVYIPRTKHIDVKFHFIRKLVNDEKIKLQYINTKSMLADGLTKALSGQKMDELLNGMKIKKVES